MKEAQVEFKVSNDPWTEKWFCDIYSGDGDWIGQTEGDDLSNVFKHALHLYDPLYFAAVFSNEYLEWNKEHKFQ
jgi:hypothetical protein